MEIRVFRVLSAKACAKSDLRKLEAWPTAMLARSWHLSAVRREITTAAAPGGCGLFSRQYATQIASFEQQTDAAGRPRRCNKITG